MPSATYVGSVETETTSDASPFNAVEQAPVVDGLGGLGGSSLVLARRHVLADAWWAMRDEVEEKSLDHATDGLVARGAETQIANYAGEEV
ncbi:MAG TPA: hypothetical protein VNT55_01490 [Baekduia sp.]|nr:hypothetical protein [Baekduia sp.]